VCAGFCGVASSRLLLSQAKGVTRLHRFPKHCGQTAADYILL
jgi:hypothetical protein